MLVCVFIADFAVTFEQHQNALSPNGAIVLFQQKGRKSLVAAVSPFARSKGVKVGATVQQARALCPQAEFIPQHVSSYRAARELLTERLLIFSNRIEAEGEYWVVLWLDIGSVSKIELDSLSQIIISTIVRDMGFVPRLGIAEGKFTARLAAITAQNGQVVVIETGDEKTFLAPFAIQRLALQKDLARQFALLGIETLGQLADLPFSAVRDRFGSVGALLHQLARGKDTQTIQPYMPPMHTYVSHEFEIRLDDACLIQQLLKHLASQLMCETTPRHLTTQEIVLLLHLEHDTVEIRHLARQPIEDEITLAQLLLHLLDQQKITSGIVGLEIRLENLKPRVPAQMDFFSHLFGYGCSPQTLVKHLSPRYGAEPFHIGVLYPHQTYLPERLFRYEIVGV